MCVAIKSRIRQICRNSFCLSAVDVGSEQAVRIGAPVQQVVHIRRRQLVFRHDQRMDEGAPAGRVNDDLVRTRLFAQKCKVRPSPDPLGIFLRTGRHCIEAFDGLDHLLVLEILYVRMGAVKSRASSARS